MRLGLAALRLAAAAPEDPSPEVAANAAAHAANGGVGAPPALTQSQRAAIEARDALIPVATHGLGLLQALLDLEQEEPAPFSFLDAAAADNGPDGVAPLLAAGPDTSPLSQLNLSSCVPITTQLIPWSYTL